MCGRKGDAENLNEKEKKTLMKRKTLEDVSVGQKVWSINTTRKWGDGHPRQKIQNDLLINKKRGESSRKVKKKEKRAALEWDDIDMQAELKSVMYIDRLLRAKKEKLIYELNFKTVMQLKRSLKSKFFVGITKKTKKIYHSSWFYGCQPRNHRSVYSESQK